MTLLTLLLIVLTVYFSVSALLYFRHRNEAFLAINAVAAIAVLFMLLWHLFARGG